MGERAELLAWQSVARRLASALTSLRTGEPSEFDPYPRSGGHEPLSLPMDAYDALAEYERLVSSSVVSGDSDDAESEHLGPDLSVLQHHGEGAA